MDNLSPENKDIINRFTVAVKDGNRLGRRLRQGLSNVGDIARGAGRSGLNQEPFDPNAFDGDGDGLIQDGSVWERPALLRSQSAPNNITPEPDTERAITDDTPVDKTRKETRRAIGLASSSAGTESSDLASRVGLKSVDPTNRDWLSKATPAEIAEAFVPDTVEEADELNESIRVPRNAYSNESDYQAALKLHRETVKQLRKLHQNKIQAMLRVYEQKYGNGSFKRDIEKNRKLFDQRVRELFGDQDTYASLIQFSSVEEARIQFTYATGVAQGDLPGFPIALRSIFAEALKEYRDQQTITHGAFWEKRGNGIAHPNISVMEYVVARLIAGHHANKDMPLRGGALGQPATPLSRTAMMESLVLIGHYLDFRARLLNEPRSITDEQLKARFELAEKSNSRFAFFGTIFPNRWNENYAAQSHFFNPVPSNFETDRKMLRALVQRTLEENPEFLEAARKFGLPILHVPHPVYNWIDTSRVPEEFLLKNASELSEQEIGRRRELGRELRKEWTEGVTRAIQRKRGDESQGENTFGATGHFDANAPLGGFYHQAVGEVFLMTPHLLVAMLAPPDSEENILELSTAPTMTNIVGEPAVFIHEYAHYLDYLLRDKVAQLLWEKYRRQLEKFTNDPNNPLTQIEKDALLADLVKDFRDKIKQFPGLNDFDAMNIQRIFLEQITGNKGPRLTPNQHPKNFQLYPVDTMTDAEIDDAIIELSGQLFEIHGYKQLLMARKQAEQGVIVDVTQISEDSKTSPEPYVVTPYGNSSTIERFAEIFAATVSRIGQKNPVLVNNAAVRMVARIIGLNTEPQDVVSMRRRKRVRQRGQARVYTDEMENISHRILSDIKVVAPNLERQSDGHRPGFSSSTSSSDLRFDPNERSRLSSRNNLGLDTDERLYASPTPTLITDYGSRARLYAIGDHHFYDRGIPYASYLDYQMRQSLGDSAGRRFINRNRPHHGDMVRAISSTQFGFFVDDMPIYDTTTDGQIDMLRGLVTGKISKLEASKRFQIEEALKDASNIHSAVQASEPTQRQLFRSIKIDRETFLESVNVGDNVPMPITAFSPDNPKVDNIVVLRLEKGAKAININNTFLTQGTFEVAKIEDDGTNVVATLVHREVFDPRHDAMRPVDRFSDVPGKMRKMGGALPRYTPAEQEKMELDLQKRKDRADAVRSRGFSSSTSDSRDPKYDDLTDEELTEFLVFEPKNREDYATRIAPTLAKFREIVSGFINASVRRRLANSAQSIKTKYGNTRPWVDDADAIRKWRSLDDVTVNRATQTLKREMLASIDAGRVSTAEGETIVEPKTPVRVWRESDREEAQKARFATNVYDMVRKMAERDVVDLSASQIEHLLRTGELIFWDNDTPTASVGQTKYDISPEVIAPVINLPQLVNPDTPELKELRQILEGALETLQAVQRAYLFDGSGKQDSTDDMPDLPEPFLPTRLTGQISINGEVVEVKPLGKGAYVTLGAVGRYAHSAMSFVMKGSFTIGEQDHSNRQYFKRDIFLNRNGDIKVRHESFFIENRGSKSNGVATLMNQHAALWWRQHEGTEIFLPNPAIDGVIVWPRMNYQFDINDPYADDPKGDFKGVRRNLIENVRALLRTDAGLPILPSSDVLATLMGPSASLDWGLKDNPEFRKRLVGWLALARIQEQKGIVDPSLMTVLANIIEPRELSRKAAENWRNLFSESGITSSGLTMTFGRTVDNDWLPSFVIPDQEDDSFVPSGQDLQRAEFMKQVSADAEFDFFIPALDEDVELSPEQAGRLEAVMAAGDGEKARLFRSGRRERYARETTAFNSPPQLVTETELRERIANGDEVYYAVTNDSIGNIGTTSELSLTSEPFRLIDRMVDRNKPELDPAQNRNGLLVFLSPNAKVISDDRLNKIINELFSGVVNEFGVPVNPTGRSNESLMAAIISKFGFEEEIQIASSDGTERTIKVIRSPEDVITVNNSSGAKQLAARLAKTLIGIENQLRLQGPGGKLEKLRNSLLEELVFTGGLYINNNIPIMLGFDAVKVDNKLQILNNAAIQVFDEKVSLAQAAQLIDDPRFRVIPKRLLNASEETLNILDRMIDNPSWFENGRESRVLPDDVPINMEPQKMNSYTYVRQARQDFGVDLDANLRRRGGLKSSTTEKRERKINRMGMTTWIDDTDDKDFANRIAKLEQQFKDLVQQLNDWEEADNAKGPDEPGDWAGREKIRKEMDKIADTFAMYINTSNSAIEKALDQEASINALTIFIDEQEQHGDVPEEIIKKLRTLKSKLEAERDEKPVSFDLARVRKRHSILKRALNNFDLQYEVKNFDGDAEDVELSELTSDDYGTRRDEFAQHLFKSIFGKQKRLIRYLSSDSERELNDRFNSITDGITDEQRNEWRQKLDSRLDSEPDADFQEDLIDMFPEDGSTRPSEVPAPTWRKVRAAMSRARSTKFDGEKAAAEEAAMRLLEKYRPDLANERFVRGLRSSTSSSAPSMSVNFAQKPIRGSSPETPSTPIQEHTLSITVDKLRALGHDIDEVDLLPTGKYGSVLRALQLETGGMFTGDMFTLIETGEIPAEILKDDIDATILSDLLAIAVQQARQNTSVIKIDGHQVKKILGPVDEEVVDVLGDEVDIAMLRAQGSPTYDQLIDVAAAQKIELVRLNRMFSTDGQINTKMQGPFLETLNRPGRVTKTNGTFGAITFYLDDDKTEIASFDKDKVADFGKMFGRSNPTMVKTLHNLLETNRAVPVNRRVQTNDAIFGAMAEMVGYDYENLSLNNARENYKDLQNIYSALTFAPTPAGQHLKRMFESRLEETRISVELIEKLGQRYVHLLRARGVNDGEIKEMLGTLKTERSFGEHFENDEPVRRGTGPILKQALNAYLRKKLGNALVPQITDADFAEFGLHETGHFILGQAFTRHGEFVANAWAWLVHGQPFWNTFVRSQRVQTELFDGYTIREKFGRKMTTQQMADWRARENRNLGPTDDLDGTPLDTMSPWLGITEQDRETMVNDTIDRIKNNPDLTEDEKLAIEAQIRGGDFFVKPIVLRENRAPTEQEVKDAIELGIDPASLHNRDDSIATFELYSTVVPLSPRLFGWMRENGTRGMSSSTSNIDSKQRHEFTSMLRTVSQLIGDSPVFMGTETPDEIRLAEQAMKRKRKQTLTRFRSIIENLEDMARRYPELQKEFAEELKRLK